jgi:trk system potassium uptake protein TrkH
MRINIRYLIKILGSIIILETIFMLTATLVAFYYGGSDQYPLLISSGIMLVSGLTLYLIGYRANIFQVGRREGLLTVTLTWITLSFFGMTPFYIGGFIDNITDAYLEAISGFTATGATVLTSPDTLPKGLLIWRSLSQWQGGIGVVVFTVALLPMFGGNANQLYDAETTGFSRERFLPRITQVAKRLSVIYFVLTIAVTVLLWLGPMDFFDAVNHAMTSISTGGFSTKNDSIGYWDSAYVEYVIMISMILGSLKLPLLYLAFKGNFKQIRKDEETKWFLFFVLFFIIVTAAWLLYNGYETGVDNIENTVRTSAFQVVSLVSTTGFLITDYTVWGQFFWFIAIVLMLICGCGGSTSGGIKMGRVLILIKNMLNEFKKQTHPTAVLPVRINGHAISQDVIYRTHIFVLVYFMIIGFSWAFFLLNGFCFDEALGTSITSISNVGPSLGIFNYGTVQDVPVIAKWYISFLMLVGRLEIFTVMTIMLPGFWKR